MNRTTEFTYTLDGKLETLTVKNSVTGDQVTRWVYGTTLADSGLASNALVRAKIFPDSDDAHSPLGNGADNIYDRVGQVTVVKDQLETVHELEYDGLGRLLHDRVTALGSGVDGAVRRLSRAYEVRGLLAQLTSWDNAAVGSGSVLNEVKLEYNDFGQLMREYQAHGGAVNTSTTPKVEYGAQLLSNTTRKECRTDSFGWESIMNNLATNIFHADL